MPLLHRLFRRDHPPIAFTLDGVPYQGRSGDSILTAVLERQELVRVGEFSQAPRAGFCQMGACQDCWVSLEDGRRLRACTTKLEPGMRIVTGRERWP
jgi:predicted molibdopterin-dependent oxidoreductase YjgC